MKSYNFLYRVDHSSVSMSYPFNTEIGEYEIVLPENGKETTITVIDCKVFSEETTHHLGLLITVDIDAEDIDTGLYNAQIRANYIAIILSFITNSTISEPILELGYETTDSAVNTQFIQYLYMDGETLKQKRAIDHSVFDNLGIAFMKNNFKRIGRAVRWYKKGLSESDSIDRFMYYWLGLECLNKLLAEELGATPQLKKCKNCDYTYESDSVNGIKSLFKRYEEDLSFGYKECRKLRAELQHGFGDLEEAIKVAEECAESCRNVLLKGLFLLLKIDQATIDRYPNPILNLIMPRIEFRGLYEITPKELKTVPSLLIDINDIEIRIIDNMRAISFVKSIDTNIPVTLKLEGVNFIAEDGVRNEINDIKLSPKDKS